MNIYDFLTPKDIKPESVEFYQSLFEKPPNFKKLESLLAAGAEINYTPEILGNTFVSVFYRYKGGSSNKRKVLEFLKHNGYDINSSGYEPGNAISYGLSRMKITIPELNELLDIGVDPEHLNYYGIDSLSVALNCGRSDCFSRMVEFIGEEKLKLSYSQYRAILVRTPIPDTVKMKMLEFLDALREKSTLSEWVPESSMAPQKPIKPVSKI